MSEKSHSPEQDELSPLEKFRAWMPGQMLPHITPDELAEFPEEDVKRYFLARR